MTSERDIQSEVWEAVGHYSVLFRNNVGAVLDKGRRLVKFGLVKGSSDLIGWTQVEITQDMVGSHVAVFTAIEIKTAKGKPTDAQQYFIARVEADGGYAGVARSVEEGMKVIERG